MLKNGDIVCIQNIYERDLKINIEVKKYTIVRKVFQYDCDLSVLYSYEVKKNKSNDLILTSLDSVDCKVIKFNINYNGERKKMYAVPLIH